MATHLEVMFVRLALLRGILLALDLDILEDAPDRVLLFELLITLFLLVLLDIVFLGNPRLLLTSLIRRLFLLFNCTGELLLNRPTALKHLRIINILHQPFGIIQGLIYYPFVLF